MRSICFAALALMCAMCFMESGNSAFPTTDLIEISELTDRIDDNCEDSSENSDALSASFYAALSSGAEHDSSIGVTSSFLANPYHTYLSQGPPLA